MLTRESPDSGLELDRLESGRVQQVEEAEADGSDGEDAKETEDGADGAVEAKKQVCEVKMSGNWIFKMGIRPGKCAT